MLYFAYCSDMFTYSLEKVIGRVEIVGVAKLPNYSFCLNKINDKSYPIGNIIYGRKDVVYGIVYRIDPKRIKDLNRLKKKTYGYVKKARKVELMHNNEVIDVITYSFSNPITFEDNTPFDWYIKRLIAGGRENGIPQVYLDVIEQIETKKDSNIFRNNQLDHWINERNLKKKYLHNSFKMVSDVRKKKIFKIDIKNHVLDNRHISIRKSENLFVFNTTIEIPKNDYKHRELQLSKMDMKIASSDKKLELIIEGKNFFIDKIEYDYEKNIKLLSGTITSLGNISPSNFKNKFLRLMIPVKKKLKIFNDYQCKAVNVDYKYIPFSLPLTVGGKSFDLYEAKYKNENFLVIDCEEKCDILDFQNYCQTILLTYAFVSGDYHSGEGYYLGYDDPLLEMNDVILYHRFSDSKYDLNAAFTSNAFFGLDTENLNKLESEEILAESRKQKYEDINFFPISVFNKICQLSLDNEKVFRSIWLLISNQNSTLEMQIPLQYVVIEALTAVIIGKGDKEPNPIPDELGKQLVVRLEAEIKEFLHENNIPSDSVEVEPLFRKLINLNTPTNSDKLSKPFLIVGYNLSKEDKKVIKTRNIYLHGSITIKPLGSLEDDFRDLFYLTLKLHHLICILLLKKAGYSGRIINYPKLHEAITEKYLDEEVLCWI